MIILTPILTAGFFSFLNNFFITPLFNIFTPLGGILLSVAIIMMLIKYVLKRPTSKAAACYVPGIGAVCAVMEYSKIEKDEYVKHHTIQGLILFVVATFIVISGLVMVKQGGPIALVGYYLISFLILIGGLVLIYMMYQAHKGEKVAFVTH
jgi:uncharacterized membrane protein